MSEKHRQIPERPAGRIRAIRHDDVSDQLHRSRMLLGLSGEFAAIDHSKPQRLARALRKARRAANAGAKDYDPVRHLLLVRYLKTLKLRSSDRKDVYGRGLVKGARET